jgi:hypothetical protein
MHRQRFGLTGIKAHGRFSAYGGDDGHSPA